MKHRRGHGRRGRELEQPPAQCRDSDDPDRAPQHSVEPWEARNRCGLGEQRCEGHGRHVDRQRQPEPARHLDKGIGRLDAIEPSSQVTSSRAVRRSIVPPPTNVITAATETPVNAAGRRSRLTGTPISR